MRASPTNATEFRSILWPGAMPHGETSAEVLHDLALDQVLARLAQDSPVAAAAFRVPLATVADVRYRQAVFQSLEQPGLREAVNAFLRGVEDVRRLDATAATAHAWYEAELWHLRAVVAYTAAVRAFRDALAEVVPALPSVSAGWTGLARHTGGYLDGAGFRRLDEEATGLAERIGALRYNALIRGGRVTIAPVDDEPDLGAEVLATFERFRQGEARDYEFDVRQGGLDHVQAWMLELAARVHPEPFAELVRFAEASREYHEPVLERFADEVRFYLVYLDHLAPLRASGLPVCSPVVSADRKELAVLDGWDLALAPRLVEEGAAVVANDLTLTGAERILVISGPNQGGKTTTARMFGQLHHLAALGCPVPGREARILLCDRVLTVFEREERLDTLEGRLGAEVQRLHEVLGVATGRSVIVLNEAFSSTALHDARILTRDVLERISALDALAACVTFIDELSRLNDKTVSMVSTVDPDDPAIRTFRVERRPADGRAYARALAAKHGLTLEQIAARLPEADPDPTSAPRTKAVAS